MKKYMRNVIDGFHLKNSTTIAINFWGQDSTKLKEIEDYLNNQNHHIVVHQVNLTNLLDMVEHNQLTHDNELLQSIKDAKVAIDIFMHPPMLPKGFPKEKLNVFQTYLKTLFQAMSSTKELFIQWRLPTEENAKASGIDPNVFINHYKKAYTVDYIALKNRAKTMQDILENKKTIVVYTDGHQLVFDISNRTWQSDLGQGDIPCGEIAIAPNESSANGSVLIKETKIENTVVKNLVLHFKNGIMSSDNDILNNYLEKFSGDKNMIGEFGIGLNDKIENLIHNALHDEKMLNTIHIAIGMNTMFGGENKSNLHHDFVLMPKKVYADDTIIYEHDTLIF